MTYSENKPSAIAGNTRARSGEKPRPDQPIPLNPYRTLIILTLAVFASEILVMMVLPYLGPMSKWSEALLDSILLSALLFPLLFSVLLRPLRQYLRERKAAEETIRESEEALRSLLSRLINVVEDERKRTSLQLNEDIIQDLVANKFQLENVFRQIGQKGGATTPGLLEPIMSEFQKIFQKIRSMAMDLFPVMLSDLGIIASISSLCRHAEMKIPEIQIEKQIDIGEKGVPDPLKIVIFRVIQEFFQRPARLPRKGPVLLFLGRQNSSLLLSIEYEGGGLDPRTAGAGDQADEIFRPPSMKERIELSGGTFLPEALTGGRNRIQASWPLTETE